MRTRTILFLVPCLPLTACWTTLEVRKVDSADRAAAPGVRYSLPRPIIRATPLADGTLEVEVEYLPDASRTYAIHSSSWFATHDLEVDVKGGLLSKVVWNADGAGVASDLIESAGEVSNSVIDARAEAEKAAREAADEARSEREEEIGTARAAVRTAEEQVELARVRLRVLRGSSNATPGQVVLTAELDLATAEQNLVAAERRLAVLLARVGAKQDEARNALANASKRKVYGPVLYAIRNDGDSVSLAAIRQHDGSVQPTYETATVSSVEKPEAPPKLSPLSGAKAVLPLRGPLNDALARQRSARAVLAALTAKPPVSDQEIARARRELALVGEEVNEAGKLVLVFRSDKPLQIDDPKLQGPAGGSESFRLDADSSTRFTLTLDGSSPEGDYVLSLKADKARPSIRFTVRLP